MKSLPVTQVRKFAEEIWSEYLAPDASCPINVDSHSHELSRKNMESPDRWTFDIAAVSITIVTVNELTVMTAQIEKYLQQKFFGLSSSLKNMSSLWRPVFLSN